MAQNQKISSQHNLEVDKMLDSLDSAGGGLSCEEAKRRLSRFCPNELVEKHKVKPQAIVVLASATIFGVLELGKLIIRKVDSRRAARLAVTTN